MSKSGDYETAGKIPFHFTHLESNSSKAACGSTALPSYMDTNCEVLTPHEELRCGILYR